MDRRIHSCLVIYRRVWEPDKKRVTHGLPYLVVEGQHFYQATQNRTWTARQSKTFILKSSRFWFYNIITHWGHPGKGVQKSNQNRNMEAKNRESNWTVIIAITWEFDCYNNIIVTPLLQAMSHYTIPLYQLVFLSNTKCYLVWCELPSNMWLSTSEISIAQLCSITEIAPKSLFLQNVHVYVNRNPMRYGFCAGAKAIWYACGANIALIHNAILLQWSFYTKFIVSQLM